MRQEQWEKLQEIEERLCDVFLAEADPLHWPKPGVPHHQLGADERAERYRAKRAAAETAMLLTRAQHLIGAAQGLGATPPQTPAGDTPPEEEASSTVEREVRAVEHEVERLRRAVMDRLQQSSRNGKSPG